MSAGSIFITGGTGYLGGYVLTELLERTESELVLLTRASDDAEGRAKLWRALQMHLDAEGFHAALDRVRFVSGDLQAEQLGMSDATRDELAKRCDSVLHIAASLNRKSAKACLNANLRGTLSVVNFARRVEASGGLRRYSQVSTTAVAGHRQSEVVGEDQSIDWARSDYDPYGRTKKFAEHMAFELLPDVPKTIFRPSIVMGDSRRSATTQFDMVGAFCGLARMPIVPLDRHTRLDIVNADFVGEAIARLHLKDDTKWERYHLSSGTRSYCTPEQIGEALSAIGMRFRLMPSASSAFEVGVRGLNRLPRSFKAQRVGALLKVFWPYITFDTLFDNTRVCTELGIEPTPFPDYCAGLFEFATGVGFKYPYVPLPQHPTESAA